MKKLLYILGSTLLKKALLSPTGSGLTAQSEVFPKLNVSYLSDLARAYLIAAFIGLASLLFFVAGTTISLFSAAQSFDLFGAFVPGAVFYTGIGLMALSSIVATLSYYSIRNNKLEKDLIYLADDDTQPVPQSPFEYLGLIRPFMEGLNAGWRKERDKKQRSLEQAQLLSLEEEIHLPPQEKNRAADFRAS